MGKRYEFGGVEAVPPLDVDAAFRFWEERGGKVSPDDMRALMSGSGDILRLGTMIAEAKERASAKRAEYEFRGVEAVPPLDDEAAFRFWTERAGEVSRDNMRTLMTGADDAEALGLRIARAKHAAAARRRRRAK